MWATRYAVLPPSALRPSHRRHSVLALSVHSISASLTPFAPLALLLFTLGTPFSLSALRSHCRHSVLTVGTPFLLSALRSYCRHSVLTVGTSFSLSVHRQSRIFGTPFSPSVLRHSTVSTPCAPLSFPHNLTHPPPGFPVPSTLTHPPGALFRRWHLVQLSAPCFYTCVQLLGSNPVSP